MAAADKTRRKSLGEIYTPMDLVDDILDIARYDGNGTLDPLSTSFLEPSCGSGNFLVRMVGRISDAARAAHPGDIPAAMDAARSAVIANLHGIEIDRDARDEAVRNVHATCTGHGIRVTQGEISERIIQADFLSRPFGDERYDLVVGNPPYVRIHNASGRCGSWMSDGMTDLFYTFYEEGMEVLRPGGTLCYIAPSSWFSSAAGRRMRAALREGGLLDAVVDLQGEQPFENAATYTAIVRLAKDGGRKAVRMATYADWRERGNGAFESIPYSQAFMPASGAFIPTVAHAREIREIADGTWDGGDGRPASADDRPLPIVKTGFQTSADYLFVESSGDFDDAVTIPAVKGTTGIAHRMVLPYRIGTSDLIPEGEFLAACGERGREVLERARDSLDRRTRVKAWYAYGRTQGLIDVCVDKVSVNLMYRDAGDLRIADAPPGTGVYGGTYVLGMTVGEVSEALEAPVFWDYLRALRRYKSGGYYALTPGEMRAYLRWWIGTDRGRASRA